MFLLNMYRYQNDTGLVFPVGINLLAGPVTAGGRPVGGNTRAS
jgi:hypothetical protein